MYLPRMGFSEVQRNLQKKRNVFVVLEKVEARENGKSGLRLASMYVLLSPQNITYIAREKRKRRRRQKTFLLPLSATLNVPLADKPDAASKKGPMKKEKGEEGRGYVLLRHGWVDGWPLKKRRRRRGRRFFTIERMGGRGRGGVHRKTPKKEEEMPRAVKHGWGERGRGTRIEEEDSFISPFFRQWIVQWGVWETASEGCLRFFFCRE